MAAAVFPRYYMACGGRRGISQNSGFEVQVDSSIGVYFAQCLPCPRVSPARGCCADAVPGFLGTVLAFFSVGKLLLVGNEFVTE